MRSPAQINRSVHQQQTDALCIGSRIKCLQPIIREGSGSRISGLYLGWTSAQLRAGYQVKRVQPLVVAAARIFAHADDKDGSVSPVMPVDDRRGGDTDFGSDLAATVIVAGRLISAEHGNLP